jgi:hypothetical protein
MHVVFDQMFWKFRQLEISLATVVNFQMKQKSYKMLKVI